MLERGFAEAQPKRRQQGSKRIAFEGRKPGLDQQVATNQRAVEIDTQRNLGVERDLAVVRLVAAFDLRRRPADGVRKLGYRCAVVHCLLASRHGCTYLP
jgi:hypothetical protein